MLVGLICLVYIVVLGDKLCQMLIPCQGKCGCV